MSSKRLVEARVAAIEGTVPGREGLALAWQHLSAELLDDVSGQHGNTFRPSRSGGMVSRTIFSR